MSTSSDGHLATLLARHRPGFGLERDFTTDPGIHGIEMEQIWKRSWLFAGHHAELAEPGDRIVVEVGDDSVVVTRAADGGLRALHNTCRHRGMRLVDGPGRADRLVCPYHQWAYGLDGRVLGCGGMDRTGEVADVEEYRLAPVAVEEAGGLVWINLAATPEPFSAGPDLRAALAAQGLERSRLAAARDYDVAADWKLIWENNRECWHCHAGHPEYVQANFDIAPGHHDAERRAREIAARLDRAGIPDASGGVAVLQPPEGLFHFPSVERWWSANRTPLRPGWVSESLDGHAVAPLMGRYRDRDVGTLRLRTLPNFWSHASGDHVVTTRLLPAGPGRTRIRVTWLVDAGAVEGRDYRLASLLPFWELTSEQDWSLCERNQAGVRSSAFRPGPYSRAREQNVLAFLDWYLTAMAPR